MRRRQNEPATTSLEIRNEMQMYLIRGYYAVISECAATPSRPLSQFISAVTSLKIYIFSPLPSPAWFRQSLFSEIKFASASRIYSRLAKPSTTFLPFSFVSRTLF